MKICLYLEFYNFLGGIFYKNIGTGLLSSYKNQKHILDHLKIPYKEKWDDDCDILQINTPWLKSVYLIKKAHRRGKKVIIWSHVTVEDFIEVFRPNKYIAPLMKKYLTYAYGLADLIFSPSEYTKSLLVAYGIPAEKIISVSNGVDTDKYYPDEEKRNAYREKYNLKNIVVGTVGLVIPRKGIKTFLKLSEKFSNFQFIWFGNIYSHFLVQPLPNDIPDNVNFAGYTQNIASALNAMDIFLFPSYEENQGMAILEAASVGLPLLVRDIPVYNGWLAHNENCLKAKSDEEFEEYLKMLLNDVNLRIRLSSAAKDLARNESVATLSKKVKAIYEHLQSSIDK